ncbi:MAG: DJ-1/PfpI family protein [Myxococcota bacterium]
MDIAILLYEGLTVLDAIGPYEVLQRLPDAHTRFVAKQRGAVRSDSGGLGLLADHALSEVEHPEVVVVPGGGRGAIEASRDEETLDWLRALHVSSRYTTSVCTGALILGGAGILDGLRATTHWAALPLLESYGARAVSERVVHEGKVITAAGVSAGIDMGLYLAAEIAGTEVAQVIQLSIEYDPKPPFQSGSIGTASPEIRERALAALGREVEPA